MPDEAPAEEVVDPPEEPVAPPEEPHGIDKALQKMQQDLATANRNISSMMENGATPQQLQAAQQKVSEIEEMLRDEYLADPIADGKKLARATNRLDADLIAVQKQNAALSERLQAVEQASRRQTFLVQIQKENPTKTLAQVEHDYDEALEATKEFMAYGEDAWARAALLQMKAKPNTTPVKPAAPPKPVAAKTVTAGSTKVSVGAPALGAAVVENENWMDKHRLISTE